ERKQRERQKRVNDILDAAEEVLFSADGMNASMDDIAARAEVSKGTLYLYFKSKESLLFGIGVRANQVTRDALAAAVRDTDTGIQQVLAIGRAYRDFARRYPNYFHFKSFSDDALSRAMNEHKDDPVAQQCQETGMSCAQVMMAAMRRGIEDGTIRSDVDPSLMTALIWAQANGVIKLIEAKVEVLEQMMGLDADRMWEGFSDFVRRALSPGAENA
ncbi:MAG TPA: TetR/AcrR family transcriptional regulator, partial [candidate division Zixibacteria bacterium]|nr:TetR/AcrR family transcriptional regulator [candidate division Zixibacteria bacterium]